MCNHVRLPSAKYQTDRKTAKKYLGTPLPIRKKLIWFKSKNSSLGRFQLALSNVWRLIVFCNKQTRGPFLESPGNFSGPESYFMCAMIALKTQILIC